ncbi:MAG TPA: sulfotransferase, partial [Acidobacteriaceae bacterium]|nr:sulfotransferase [Acidobacteriaceae bacterium]
KRMAPPEDPILPNFFIAGAPKAGTTSLYHHLRQHPEVFMSPVKEPTYFSFEARPENFIAEKREWVRGHMENLRASLDGHLEGNRVRGIVERWEDYVKLFRNANGQKAIGEASVFYLWSKTAAPQIAATIPHAKILLILRHPAERAFSQYLHSLSDGHTSHSFSYSISEGLRNTGELSIYYPFLEFGLYSSQVERFFACFPREQVRVWLYEDTLAAPAKFLRDVSMFLGIDPGFVPDTSRRYFQMEIPRVLSISQPLRRSRAWRAVREHTPAAIRPLLKRVLYHKPGELKMNPADRRFLIDYYRDDIGKLERLIERDLSRWLE